jgi:hypothetical protein
VSKTVQPCENLPRLVSTRGTLAAIGVVVCIGFSSLRQNGRKNILALCYSHEVS